MDPDIQQNGGPTIGVGDYLSVFSRRAWLIVIPFLIVLGVAAGLGFLLPAQFEAQTVIEVKDTADLNKLYESVDLNLPHKAALTTIRQVIKRRRFLEEIVDARDIREGFDVSNPREKTRLFKHITKKLRVRLSTQKEGPDVIEILYQGREARKVCNFVNDIRERYVSDFQEKRREDVRRVLDDLKSRLDIAVRVEKAAAEAYQRFQEDNDFQLLGEKTLADKRNELARVQESLADAKTELEEVDKQLDKVKADLVGIPERVEGEDKKVKNPDFLAQRSVVQKLEAELKRLRDKFHDTMPAIGIAESKLAIERSTLNALKEFVSEEMSVKPNPIWEALDEKKRNLAVKKRGLEARIDNLGRRETRLQEEVDKIPALTREAADKKAVLSVARDQLARVRRRYNAARGLWARENSPEGSFFRVLHAPILEDADTWDPVFPSVPLFVGIGAFIGLLMGAGLAFLVEFSSSSFVTIGQLRRTLPVTVLGQVATIRTVAESRRRRARKVTTWVAVIAIVAVVVFAHVCYFSPELRGNLPTWLFAVMKRFYGAQ